MTKFTHKITFEVGLDLETYLAPENINGVKAYLGAENDVDVVEKIGRDKFHKIQSILNENSFVVLGASMSPIESQVTSKQVEEVVPAEKTTDTQKEIIENEIVETKEAEKNENTKEENEVLQLIESAKDKVEDKGLITKIVINKTLYEKGINSIEMLKAVSGLYSGTEIEFENFDEANQKLRIELMDVMGRKQIEVIE